MKSFNRRAVTVAVSLVVSVPAYAETAIESDQELFTMKMPIPGI